MDEDINEEDREGKLNIQKELIYNKLLPYSNGLDEESRAFLSEIKKNLSKAVLVRELRPGAVTWTGRLLRYINLYGLKFSLDDHIKFIKLLYELILIPDLEASMISLFASTLHALLKKSYLISPAQLQLPWRPLYKLMQSILDSPYEDVGLLLIPSGLDHVLRNVVKCCRDYFPLGSTEEMLMEWRPLLCPFDQSVTMGIGLLETFLPTRCEPKDQNQGHLLWFDELTGLWSICHNQPSWEVDLVLLFSRLADHNIGYINWDPVTPLMFSKILHNFGLPVCYRQQRGQVGHKFDMGAIVTWIVANLGGGSNCQDHLSSLFKTIESYYHPSNVGAWNAKLNEFLRRLPVSFVKRLHRERSTKKSWMTPIPESHKLTDNDIERFVQSLLPIALLAMFSRVGAYEASMAFHQMAQLRPDLVVPPLLERLYSAVDTVTEPHRLTAALQCVVSVVRPLVSGGKAYPEGPSHVIPLLMASLPAVDTNDIRKTLVTFQLVTTIATLVPIVDCSSAIGCHTMTEEEKELCLQTVGFEDFVLQFMDRCFSLVDSSALEQTRMDKGRTTEKMTREESLLEVGLSSTIASLLMQCSGEIFDSALNKLHSFVGGRAFETNVSGKFAAHIVSSVTKVNAGKVLNIFLPHLFRYLDEALATEEILNEETLQDEMLFNLHLLSELMRCPGNFLLPYADSIIRVLDRALLLTSREGYQFAGGIMSNALRSLTTIYPTNYRSVAEGYDRPLSDYLPIRDWGKPGDIHNLQMNWHVPSVDERQMAERMLHRYLGENLKKLDRHSDQSKSLKREELQRTLSHVLDCILGSGAVLPPWQEDAIVVVESKVVLTLPLQFSHFDAKAWQIHLSDGQPIRLTVANTLSKLVNYLLSTGSDNTKALFSIISIFQMLLFYYGVLKDDFETHQKNFQMVKKVLGCNLVGRKMDIRALLIDRVQLQHELRVLESAFTLSVVTPTMRNILKNLIQLATSQYSEVRSRAQAVLSYLHRQSPLAYQVVIDDMLAGLRPEATHEQLKGTLYILAERASKQRSLLVLHNWNVVHKLWPAIVECGASEKISIIQLLDAISTLLFRTLETTSVKLSFTQGSIEAAQSLMPDVLSKEELAVAVKKEEEWGDNNKRLYYELLNSLVRLLNSGTLHWRRYNLAFNMLTLQLRADLPPPPEVVKIFVQNLISEQIAVRKIAIKGVAAIFKQQKREHKKLIIDPVEIARQFSGPGAEGEGVLRIGIGDQWSNNWMQYNEETRPLTAEAWNQPRFVHKTHFGFYGWPKEMEVYAPDHQQPPVERSFESLSPGEAEVSRFFSNPVNIEKLIGFLSLEERKGKDKFDATRFSLFKGLFRNHGNEFLDNFKPHLEKLVRDPQEASQRCAAEIITGLIRGSKHWPFAKAESLWNFLCPLLRVAFSNVNVESINDWGTAIATASENRDPNRNHWLMELILEEPIRREQGSSFTDSSRLYMLQGGIAQQEWRVAQLLSRLLKLLMPYLNHPYQSMRDRLGSVLTNIFLHDVQLPGGTQSKSPRVEPFVNELLPQLACLLNNNGSRDSPVAESDVKPEDEEERSCALRLLKTVSQWLAGMWSRTYGCHHEVQLQFLPFLCTYESNDVDKELARECSLALCFIAQTVMHESPITVALETVYQVAQNGTWKAKISALEFLQVLTFNNIFTITRMSEGVNKVTGTVLLLLSDDRLEVREKAAQVLGGLLHCDFLDDQHRIELLTRFRKQISRKLPRGLRATVLPEVDMALIVKRHAGILGLCAFVDAYPYEVPEFLPDVLVLLGDHLNDPQPIPVTVKKTLSNFRRTHHDNWQLHKLKFSDDQLVTLTDLLVSPNYYA